MKRLDKAKKIGQILDKLYPKTPIPLNHDSAYTLIVAVMLSAQTTDKKVTGPYKFLTNINLLKKVIKWKPKYSLEKGLLKTYNIMKNY